MLKIQDFYESIQLYKKYPCEIHSMMNGILHKGRHSTFCYGFIFNNDNVQFPTNFFVISKTFDPKEKKIQVDGYLIDKNDENYKLSIEHIKDKVDLLCGYNDQGDLMTLEFNQNLFYYEKQDDVVTEGKVYITISRGDDKYGFIDEKKKILLKDCMGNLMKINLLMTRYFQLI